MYNLNSHCKSYTTKISSKSSFPCL